MINKTLKQKQLNDLVFCPLEEFIKMYRPRSSPYQGKGRRNYKKDDSDFTKQMPIEIDKIKEAPTRKES